MMQNKNARRLLAAVLVLLMALSMMAAGSLPEAIEEDEQIESLAPETEQSEAVETDTEEIEALEEETDMQDAEAVEVVNEVEAVDAEAADAVDEMADAVETLAAEPVAVETFHYQVGPIPRSVPVTLAAAKSALKAPALKAAPTPSPSPSPIVLDKNAELSEDGKSVKITLENYTTGASIITEQSDPLDIVLVLDVTYSMENSFGDVTRLDALKSAVNSFLNVVKESGENHKVAIVRFAGSTGQTVQTLQSIDQFTPNSDGTYTVVNNITMLGGGTYPTMGLNAAKQILNGRTEKRNSTVILFTDGEPYGLENNGNSWNVSGTSNASKAVQAAYDLKHLTPTCTVFTVAINDNQLYPVTGKRDAIQSTDVSYDVFLNAVSSNYLDATPMGTSMPNMGTLNPALEGTDKSYYHLVSDPKGLTDVFTSIATEIGGSSIQLGSDTAVNDTVTPYFTVPKDAANVTIQTAKYQGGDDWETPKEAADVTPEFNGDKLTVTGFDYSANWVGYTTNSDGSKTPRGQKLIITFTVPVKPLYLGGSVTKTNGADSGIYESADATEPVQAYDVPDVNVPLKTVTPQLEDKHIYLTQDAGVLDNLITNDTKFTVGATKDVSFSDLFDGNNNANVDVTFTLKDDTGSVIGTYTVNHGEKTGAWTWAGGSAPALTGDHYTLSSCVTDIEDPDNQKEVETAANIFVYKPEMTFHDQSKYYGEDITFPQPTDIQWKCGDKVADETTMGNAPSLTVQYTPAENAVKRVNSTDYVVTTSDFAVAAVIKVDGQDMTDLLFSEKKIARACDADASHTATSKDAAFYIHVNKTSMTVTKVVDGLFANMSRNYGFEVTFKHPAITLADQTFSLKHNQSENIDSLPVGTEVTVTETDVPSSYSVSYAWTIGKTEVGAENTYTLTREHVDVTVKNVLKSIPITGVLAGTGPAMVAALIALLSLTGLIVVRVEKRKVYRRK